MRNGIPGLLRNRTTGRWFVRLPDPSRRSGYRQVYLGHDEPEARRRYDALIQDWLANGRRLPQDPEALPEPGDGELTLTDLCSAFWKGYVAKRYLKGGEPTTQRGLWRTVMRHWLECFPGLLVQDYDLDRHDRFRDALCERGLCRSSVNRYLAMTEKVIRWSAARKLAPRGLADELRELDPLPPEAARVTRPIEPVARNLIEDTLPLLPAFAADLVRIQGCTGMRPGEAVALRASWIDFEPEGVPDELQGKVAIARIEGHKTAHRGKERLVLLGPEALAIVRRNLAPGRDRIFVGEDGQAIDVPRYRQLIHGACRKGKLPKWSPNQLRHSLATEARRTGSIDVAQALLGHSDLTTTQRYAEKDMGAALRWIAKNG